MIGALGYTLAILAAALALRRLPVELARWQAQRRDRLPGGASGLTGGGPGGGGASGPTGGGRLRRRLRRALNDAAVPVNEPQAVAVWAATAAVAAMAGAVLVGAPGAVVAAPLGLAAPAVALWGARRRRKQLIVEELPDFLERVARSLRAGVSTVAALEEVRPAAGPLRADLKAVMADVQAGRSLEVALDRWRVRSAIPEVNLATAALCIGAGTGGRRAPAVDGVAATLREARASQRELSSLAQQGRLSGLLVALLPLGFLALSAMLDSGSVAVLYGTPLGLFCLFAGVVLNFVAFVWMQRITRLP